MSAGRILISVGVLLIVAGGLVLVLERVGLRPGRLPGDLHWQGRNWQVSFPLVTSLLLSVLLTVLLWIFGRMRG